MKQASSSDSPFTLVNAAVSKSEGKKANKETNKEANKEVPLYGVVPDNNMVVLRDESGMALNKKVQNGAILTKAAAASLKVKMGDKVTITNSWSEKEITLPIAGIADIDIGSALYWDKQKVNKYLGLPDSAYLGKWTNEKPSAKEQGILSAEDKNAAKKAFEEALGPLKYSIVLISLFSFAIGFIMIRLITGLMIEESMTSISLLKVIGYDDRKISKMMLNVYLPVVFL
ncbi:FtsX-like permease family protein [Metabacillus sp. RGM 3146]|uniref:FtsX-like permease family protein n=1 Tax=Metabacillus sp. RGM 3146 TaxID=3401092 RepID=UPI003B995C8C